MTHPTPSEVPRKRGHRSDDPVNETPDGIDEALDFLEVYRWRHGRGATVTAIPSGRRGGTATRPFGPADRGDCRDWLSRCNGNVNLYFTINSTRGRVYKKPSKAQIATLDALHVDVDPRDGYDLNEERSAILARLRAFKPAPTVIWDSGRGYWALWALATSIKLARNVAEVEAYNVALASALGGDACHNVDRLARLPGTTNLRARRRAEIVEADWDRQYRLTDFEPAPIEARPDGATNVNVELPAELPEIDVENLPLGDRWRIIAHLGHDPGLDPDERKPSRSEWVMAVARKLVDAGAADALIAAVLLDPDLGVSAHVREQPNPITYAARQVARARMFAELSHDRER